MKSEQGELLYPGFKRHVAFNDSAPYRPAGGFRAGEKLDAGKVAHQLDEPVPCLGGLLTVNPKQGVNELAHARVNPSDSAATGKQAIFGVGACPFPHTKMGTAVFGALVPSKGSNHNFSLPLSDFDSFAFFLPAK
jgi:hypothetical protein